MSKLICDIITPERPLFSGPCDGVIAPAFDGLVGIRPGHAPFVTELGVGIAEVYSSDETGKKITKRFAVREGFLQVLGEKVTLLAVAAVTSNEMPKPEALAAERAKIASATTGKMLSATDSAKAHADRKWIDAREQLRVKEAPLF